MYFVFTQVTFSVTNTQNQEIRNYSFTDLDIPIGCFSYISRCMLMYVSFAFTSFEKTSTKKEEKN